MIRPTKLSHKRIRNVSIITALSAQKDRINELGSVCFAAETGQTLTDFYSIDRFGSPPDAAEKKTKGRKSKASGKYVSNEISSALQKIIWNLPLCHKLFSRKTLPLYWYACYNQK